eukprot:3510286-Prymnesium_polylepis.1
MAFSGWKTQILFPDSIFTTIYTCQDNAKICHLPNIQVFRPRVLTPQAFGEVCRGLSHIFKSDKHTSGGVSPGRLKNTEGGWRVGITITPTPTLRCRGSTPRLDQSLKASRSGWLVLTSPARSPTAANLPTITASLSSQGSGTLDSTLETPLVPCTLVVSRLHRR